MAFDFSENIDTESEVGKEIFDDISGKGYLERGVLKTGYPVFVDAIKKITNLPLDCKWERIIEGSELTYACVNNSQYMILLLGDRIDKEYSIKLEKEDWKNICRPILIFKPYEEFESNKKSSWDPTKDNTLYCFVGLGAFKIDKERQKISIEVLYDMCNLPI